MQNFMKTILSGVQTWTKGKIKESIAASTADWNQNDSSADNYVKNRTHWEEKKEPTLWFNKTVSGFELITNGKYHVEETAPQELICGEYYTVIWDGATYSNLNCYTYGSDSNIGGLSAYPFEIVTCKDGGYIPLNINTNSPKESHTISIYKENTVVHKLDSKYIDLPINVATTYDVQEVAKVANEAQTTANTAVANAVTAQTTADGKMDASNPVGTGSFSMNRKSGTTVGTNSHAEGSNTTASGTNSHAEGCYTTASGNFLHSQGKYNEEINYIISEPTQTTIEADSSKTYYYSNDYYFSPHHGTFNLKNYRSSSYTIFRVMSPGTYFTITYSSGRTYIYEFISYDSTNKIVAINEYTNKATTDYLNQYAHIVGNGISNAERSNAHTLDWNGVGWFQGGLQVGGNAQDDGARNVLLEGDAIPVPETAEAGQILFVKAVDENGKPVEWEATDLSASGGSGCIASDTAPEDTSVLWIDTSDDSGDQLPDADLTGYATEQWVEDQNYLTEVPEGYAKTEDIPTNDHINSLINTALGVIENGTY